MKAKKRAGDKETSTRRDLGLQTRRNRALEDRAEPIGAPALAKAAEMAEWPALGSNGRAASRERHNR